MPRVALLVPCYNAANFIAPFLAMVRAQTRPYDEIRFYDDASTDDSVQRIGAAGMHVLRGEHNHGAAYARNRLLAATSAEFIHFHDVDDELDPAFVATLLPRVTPDRAACSAYRRRLNDGRIQREDRFRDLPIAGPRVAYFLEHFLHFNAVIYPRVALLEAGGFNEKLRISEDVHLLLRLAATNLGFHYHDEVLTTWQLRPDSTFHSRGARGAALGILEALADLVENWPAVPRRELGPTLLETAWTLNQLGDPEQARRAARLAEQCGERRIDNRGRRARWLSRWFGPACYFRYFAPQPESRGKSPA
jgi:glycosyltransferase involved in cell wall biosynthesis